MSYLSYQQRYTIEVLLKDGKSQTEIAKIISVNKSVICREIKRNCDQRNGAYKANLSQAKYESRLSKKRKFVKITPEVDLKIRTMIKDEFSPEQVAGTLKKNMEV